MAGFTSCKVFLLVHASTYRTASLLQTAGRSLPRRHHDESWALVMPSRMRSSPYFEFVTIVVAGLHGAVDGHLGEVGILVRPESLEDVSCDLRNSSSAFRVAERQCQLCQRESVDVAVQDRVRMG